VRKRRFELLWYYYRQPLKLVRLPVPPLPRGATSIWRNLPVRQQTLESRIVTKTLVQALCLVAVAASAPACADRPARAPAMAANAQIDALFTQWNKPDSAGCSVGVSRNGERMYERGYGTANLELNVPITPASVFEAASISKQFTAMSIMLLAERGRLSLDDEIRKYLPEMPDYGSPLTIRHLLNHTSGLRDAFLLLELSLPEDSYGDRNDVILKQLARQRSLNYKPGTELVYNNGGYVLSAIIVKRVSGQPLAAFADENIFKPLGMTSTRFQDDPSVTMPNRASNYVGDGGRWRVVPFGTQPGAVGNSGLWTTTSDLLRWASNLADPRVGSPRLLADMQTPAPVTSPDKTQFGLGFEVGEHRGARFTGHGGGDSGIDNYFAWYPQQRLAIAVLCNTDNTGSRQLTQRIADLYLPAPAAERAPPAAASVPAIKLSSDELVGKAGLYREAGGDMFVRTFVRDGELRGALGTGTGDSFALVPASEARFTIPGSHFEFEFAPAGSATASTMRAFEGQTLNGTFERVEPFAPTPAQLRDYAGRYASDELNVVWTISVRDSGLVIERIGNADTPVSALAIDMFTTIGDFMRFTRDGRGAITGFTLVSNGARSLAFTQVK
jgi:CubicO group peptidase (beta-lactamase class C family)